MAILAQELRIGNLVYYHIEDSMDERKKWDEISSIDYDDLRILTEFKDNSEYNPIPLTEEWLLKFGLWKYYGRFYKQPVISIDRDLKVRLPRNYANIIYVHQLQNLYFALTGYELIM